MNLRNTIIVTTFIYFANLAHAGTVLPAFSQQQELAIGKIAAAYLIDHPEILVQVSQSLQKKQAERQRERFSAAAVK